MGKGKIFDALVVIFDVLVITWFVASFIDVNTHNVEGCENLGVLQEWNVIEVFRKLFPH